MPVSMHLPICLRQQYSSLLPPSALLRRLEHTVPPRPVGLLWRLGIRRLPCWGKIDPTTSSFRARMPWGRSDGPVIRGHWQAATSISLPLAGTTVQLTIRPPLSEMIGGGFMLSCISAMSVLIWHSANSPRVALIPASFGVLFALFFLANNWWSIRRAERHFQAALMLQKLVTQPA
jgi:hypothetical protein